MWMPPFFHISELVTDDKKENFIKFLNKTGVSEQKTKHKNTDQSAEEAAGFLAQHVMYVNPLADSEGCRGVFRKSF